MKLQLPYPKVAREERKSLAFRANASGGGEVWPAEVWTPSQF